MKKILAFLTSIAVFFAALPPNFASASEISYDIDGGKLYFDTNSRTVFDCSTRAEDVVIPQRIGGVRVEEIDDHAFEDSSIVRVSLPEGLSVIGENAFGNCNWLEEVAFPNNSLSRIGSEAFFNCALTEVDIPGTVDEMGYGVFSFCEKLEKAVIGYGVKRIEKSTFESCYSLREVSIPVSVEYIGENAFARCSALSDIYYEGSARDWDRIDIYDGYDAFPEDVDIHFGSSVDILGDKWTDKMYSENADLVQKAQTLYDMGLLKGTGNEFDMESLEVFRNATRTEICVTIVRMLGKEEKAHYQANAHPFTDVPDWAGDYVGWLYENYLVNGVSDTYFGADNDATVSQFVTMMLRVLGYDDSEDDFTYDRAPELALSIGLIDAEIYSHYELSRGDMIVICYNALWTNIKNSRRRLIDSLDV